jgi:hypothetical protein
MVYSILDQSVRCALLSRRRSVVLTVHHGGILRLSDDHTLPDENLEENLGKGPFSYMFPKLQDDPKNNLLPEFETTAADLQRLGMKAMRDPANEIPGIRVPAIHTFLAQFIDHDITLMDDRGAHISLAAPTPLSPDRINKIVNARSPNLDLDNVYGPNIDPQLSPPTAPDDPRKMKIERVVGDGGLPKGVHDEWHDFPRVDNKVARIGDSRDAENLILAQLHVAFLRAHNVIVDERQCDFEEARKLLIQHYQWIVLDNFLNQICDRDVVKKIRYSEPKFFTPSPESFYMPLEFAVAAYRFGHSKVRSSYPHFNSEQENGTFNFLFGFTNQRLPDNWVISWPSFLDTENEERLPRRIDTTLSGPLLSLGPDQLGGQDPTKGNLAVRNLLRGYMLKMPTGQAVARAMASEGIQPLTPDEITSVTAEIPILNNGTQADFLKTLKTDFFTSTPLWFYILAEAAFHGDHGNHLGPVGSTIVAEVLIGVLRNSTYSILTDLDWKGPTLKGETPGKFDIADLLKLAGVI